MSKLISNCNAFLYGLMLAIPALYVSCNSVNGLQQDIPTRIVTDALGRKIAVAETIRKIYTLRAGALRMVCYMLSADKVSYIEQNEKNRTVGYLMANPFLKGLPVMGVGNSVDPELLAASDVDVVIATYMTAQEADQLQEKTGKAVFVVTYGDMVDMKKDFYNGLNSLGVLLKKQQRADSLISFIEENIREWQTRVSPFLNSKTSAYIGGVAFNGAHGLASTRVHYPPFYYLGISNPADMIMEEYGAIGSGQKNTLLNIEQVLQWDPPYIFLDVAGKSIWEKELSRPVFHSLSALKEKNIYTVLPFNWHSINFENLLCNTWFIGKTIFPQGFSDVETAAKAKQVMLFFYGTDIFPQLASTYQPFVPAENKNN
ncbi:MAG TPA: ABC transporter substrate-binding protein [Niabella sp.]|nr:ABC transporter substrate-binding protein [Niabella sp.]